MSTPFPPIPAIGTDDFVGMRLAGACTSQLDAVGRLAASLQINASRIAAELGWRPAHDPEQGLILTAKAYSARIKL